MKIEYYDFGEVIVDGKEYAGDVIIFPDRVRANWWRKEGHSLCIDDLKNVIPEKPEIIIIGTGFDGYMKILPETKKYIENQNTKLIVETTKKAIEMHNELQFKHIITCLHLTC
ncbi:MAG TPA: hypothetical protein DCX95_05800 [Elusimicrobia bacterium]|nr:hypothetical protein [Elusimicrobiota bacterium]